MKLEFDIAADSAYFEIAAAEVSTTKEIEPGIIADYDTDGHLVGIEVLSVSKRTRPADLDKVVEQKPATQIKRRPSPKIDGLGSIHDDLILPAADPEDWETLK